MLFIVLIPIIAYILVHEYNTFPEKLSKKVPTQIVSDLRQNFDTMNQQIVRNIMSELSKQIAAQQRNKRLLSPSKANSSKKNNCYGYKYISHNFTKYVCTYGYFEQRT